MTLCHECESAEFVEVRKSIDYDGAFMGVFRVLRCPNCGTEVVDPAVSRELDAAFDALEAAGRQWSGTIPSNSLAGFRSRNLIVAGLDANAMLQEEQLVGIATVFPSGEVPALVHPQAPKPRL